jgi:hypothetical protein
MVRGRSATLADKEDPGEAKALRETIVGTFEKGFGEGLAKAFGPASSPASKPLITRTHRVSAR